MLEKKYKTMSSLISKSVCGFLGSAILNKHVSDSIESFIKYNISDPQQETKVETDLKDIFRSKAFPGIMLAMTICDFYSFCKGKTVDNKDENGETTLSTIHQIDWIRTVSHSLALLGFGCDCLTNNMASEGSGFGMIGGILLEISADLLNWQPTSEIVL